MMTTNITLYIQSLTISIYLHCFMVKQGAVLLVRVKLPCAGGLRIRKSVLGFYKGDKWTKGVDTDTLS